MYRTWHFFQIHVVYIPKHKILNLVNCVTVWVCGRVHVVYLLSPTSLPLPTSLSPSLPSLPCMICRYASYLVLLSKFIPHPDSLEIPMFFGFVGLIDGLLLIPVVAFWHYTGIEPFEWPTTYEVWTILLVNGFVGTVLSELLWLWWVVIVHYTYLYMWRL